MINEPMRFILLDSEEIAKIPKEVAITRTRMPSQLEKIRFTINKTVMVKRVR